MIISEKTVFQLHSEDGRVIAEIDKEKVTDVLFFISRAVDISAFEELDLKELCDWFDGEVDY